MEVGDQRVLKASKRAYCCVHEYTQTGDYIKYGNARFVVRIEFYDNNQVVDCLNEDLERDSRVMTEAEKAKYLAPTTAQMEAAARFISSLLFSKR